ASSAPPMSHLPFTGWPSVGTTDRELLYRKRLLWPLPSRSASRSADSLVVPLQVAVAARLPVPAATCLRLARSTLTLKPVSNRESCGYVRSLRPALRDSSGVA